MCGGYIYDHITLKITLMMRLKKVGSSGENNDEIATLEMTTMII